MKPTFVIAGSTLICALVAAPAMADEDAQIVKISLKEWDLGVKNVQVDGEKARFEIVNNGKYTHSIELEGKIAGHDIEYRAGDLKPGERTSFTVELPEGKYEIYCPVDGHEDKGMKGTVEFSGD